MFVKKYILEPIKTSYKYLKSSKTLIFNSVLGLAGAIQLYSGFLSGLFSSKETFGVFMVVVATVGTILRFVTNKSVKEKVQENGDV